MTEIELAYIAGFFDGEGCVNFTKNKGGSGVIRVLIVNTNLTVLELIQENFGGSIFKKVWKGDQAHWKDSYSLRITAKSCRYFLKAIKPYVRIKINQIELSEAFYKMQPGKGRQTVQNNNNAQIYNLFKEAFRLINKKGK